MATAQRALLLGVVLVPGCLKLGGSGDSSTAASATSTATTTTTTSTAPSSATSATSTTSMSSTTSSTTSTSSSSTSTEGCSFLGCADASDMFPDWCDVWAQDCPEGEKCMPWADDGGSSWNALKCTPVDPNPDLPGEPCTVVDGAVSGVDSCVLGAMCWFVDNETGEGTCVAFCEGSRQEPSCDPGFYCSIAGNGFPILCLPMCDPLIQDCQEGESCIESFIGFACELDASGDGGHYGDPCEYINVCDPGLHCQGPEQVPGCQGENGCCSPFCDTTAPNTCPGEGQVCIPWYAEGEAPQGYEDVGVCGIPR